MIKEAIIKLSKKEDLTYEMAETVMDEIMSGEASPVQMSAYLTAPAGLLSGPRMLKTVRIPSSFRIGATYFMAT